MEISIRSSLLLCLLTVACLLDTVHSNAFKYGDASHAHLQPRDESEADLSKRQNINQYYTYAVDVTAATQQATINAKQQAGYRIISLSVYGNPQNPLYSTVWSNRPTVPNYRTIFTNVTDEFGDWVGISTSRGYSASLISVTGPATQPQFAAVFEDIPGGFESMLQYDMTDGDSNTPGTFEYYYAQAYNNHMRLKCISIYGGPNDRRWAAVWESNPNLVAMRYQLDTAAVDFPQTVTTDTLNPGFRLTHVSLDTDQTYASLYTNDRLASSTSWQQKSGLTHAALIQAIQSAATSGLAPICISGGGSTSNTNIVYAVILAPTDVIDTRVMQQPVGSVNSTQFESANSAVQTIHNLVQGYMRQYSVRYAQISIKKDRYPRMDWAYAYTEPNNCAPFICSVSPSNKFLLASNSKIFLEAAITRLIYLGKISLDTIVFETLGYLPGTSNAPNDIRYLEITVNNCLTHYAGWNTSLYDPTYDMRNIALTQRSDGQPATKQNVVDYMVKHKKVDFQPGEVYDYSNFGYLTLSLLIEKVTGVSYWTWLYNNILVPSGVNLAQISEWQTAETPRPAGEITQESFYNGPSALNPTSNAPVPAVYSGDGMIKEVDTGAADIACSMNVLSQFIVTNAVWGYGGPGIGSRYGSTNGAWTWAEQRLDGVDWTLAFNTRDWQYPQYTGPDANNDQTPINLVGQIDAALDNMIIYPHKDLPWSG